MKQVLRLLTVFFVIAVAMPAMAQQTNAPVFRGGTFTPEYLLSPQPQSGQEALLISFFRNGGRTPDFKKWSFMTEKVMTAPGYDRNIVALNEQVRLQTAFQNMDPSTYLVIHAPIDVSQYSSTQELLFLPVLGKSGALTQDIYSEKMAIIINDLKKFQTVAMNNAQASVFYGQLSEGQEDKPSIPAFVEFIVKPSRTIFSKDGRIGKGDHYLYFVDLAQITLWSDPDGAGVSKTNSRPLWSWKADWYKTKDDNAELLQLYKAIN